MTSCPWTSWGMTKPQAQEFQLLETRGEMKGGSEKKIEHLPNGKRYPEEKAATHPMHSSFTVHACGVIKAWPVWHQEVTGSIQSGCMPGLWARSPV